MNSLPCIAYGVNTDHINSSSPPKSLGGGDRLNYIQLNVTDLKDAAVHIVRLSRHSSLDPNAPITLSLTDGADRPNPEHLDIELNYHQLCLLNEIVNSMVLNVGKTRGDKVV